MFKLSLFSAKNLSIFFITWLLIAVNPSKGFNSGQTDVKIQVKDVVYSLNTMSFSVLPEEEVIISLLEFQENDHFILKTGDSLIAQTGRFKWVYRAPSISNIYPLQIYRTGFQDPITVNMMVLVPFNNLKSEYLNGYRIGKYPLIPLKQLPIYNPPRGFIELTEENENVMVSPHFRIKDFLTKQTGDFPKYLVLKTKLLIKLELILQEINESGFHYESFLIMSGYRTPFYNKAIGNVKYSRHVWGGAADIFLDEHPADGLMDDLNRDGKSDYQDALVIYEMIDKMYGQNWYQHLVGGLGLYHKTKTHGPFIHVDVRGFRARWGD